MRCVIDIECNALVNPTKIWVIVCKDIDKGVTHVFRSPTDKEDVASSFISFCSGVHLWIGHNCLAYDFPILEKLLSFSVDKIYERCYDTFVISKMADFGRKSHSLEDYGKELGFPKLDFHDWSAYSKEMEDYCVNDVGLNHLVFDRLYHRFIKYPCNKVGIIEEQRFVNTLSDLHRNGFGFDSERCRSLLRRVSEELGELDDKIQQTFLPRLKPRREINPRVTKYGTLNKSDFRWVKSGDLSEFNGGPFTRCEWVPFNPASPIQTIHILNEAGWKPVDKTKAHVECRRAYARDHSPEHEKKLQHYAKFGWKINETNLATLPSRAPPAAKTLARRILLESRRKTLTEWLTLVQDDGRIHGQFLGIGAWTQRMAHQKPNMANIPNATELDGSVKLLGAEMRSLFIAPPKRLLVGVDAEGIQLRIFAHYIDDPEFTESLVNGNKAEKTDCHSLNQRVLGTHCKTRAAAKRFIYALLLGAGVPKLAQILECSVPEAQEALARLLVRYDGFRRLKENTIPKDAARGFFYGLDGRQVFIPGETKRDREHLAMSGYLQNGEVVVMKRATNRWIDQLRNSEIIIPDWMLVNLVHDEWQTECSNDFYQASLIAKTQCEALREVGEELKLKCPLAGSYGDDPNNPKTWTIGRNWKVTH